MVFDLVMEVCTYHVLSLSSGDSACPQPHLLLIILSAPMPESFATEESSLLEFFPRLQKPDLGRFPVARRLEDRRKKGDLRRKRMKIEIEAQFDKWPMGPPKSNA